MSSSGKLIIAIDGPAGAGKSTVGKMLALRLGALYIDSGATYRAIAWRGLKEHVLDPSAESERLTPEQEARLTKLAETTALRLEGDPYHLRIFADGEDITTAIRTPQVTRFSSVVSTVAGVRTAMVAEQRRMAAHGSVVMDGRDIGTHVFPHADVKFFLDASIEARSRRRFEEQLARGDQVTLENIRAEVLERDRRDRTRAVSPLRPAEDAVHVDTSELAAEEVVNRMVEIIHKSC